MSAYREGCLPPGRCLPRGCLPRGCLPRGCLPPGGVCLQGVSASRGCLPPGGVCLGVGCLPVTCDACWEAITQTEWHTGGKTLIHLRAVIRIIFHRKVQDWSYPSCSLSPINSLSNMFSKCQRIKPAEFFSFCTIFLKVIRMHSSRMRTAHFNGHLGLRECLPLVLGVYTPPGQTASLGRHPVGRHPLCRHPLPGACWDTHSLPTVCWDTHSPCEQNDWQTGVKNITLPQTSFAGGKNSSRTSMIKYSSYSTCFLTGKQNLRWIIQVDSGSIELIKWSMKSQYVSGIVEYLL